MNIEFKDIKKIIDTKIVNTQLMKFYLHLKIIYGGSSLMMTTPQTQARINSSRLKNKHIFKNLIISYCVRH
jgi:hypothetical protein